MELSEQKRIECRLLCYWILYKISRYRIVLCDDCKKALINCIMSFKTPERPENVGFLYLFVFSLWHLFLIYNTVNIEGKAHAGNATQNIHPPLMQNTRIHIQPHILHHSYIYQLKIHERDTQSKDEDKSTALARSVAVIYYWGLTSKQQIFSIHCKYV